MTVMLRLPACGRKRIRYPKTAGAAGMAFRHAEQYGRRRWGPER